MSRGFDKQDDIRLCEQLVAALPVVSDGGPRKFSESELGAD